LIALLGTATFVLFEIYGPLVIVLSIISSLLYFVWFNKRPADKGELS
jgi:UDP-N-acetylmuramyl pentapeptide phosphotransferase/UDP-N-acetylglucosamine-1-phosphate transferase